MQSQPTFIEVRDEDDNTRIMVRLDRIVSIVENDDETATIAYYDGENGEVGVNTVENYDDLRAKLVLLGLVDP